MATKRKAESIHNKYYVGAASLSPNWAKPTEEAAIRHAQQLMNEDDFDENNSRVIVKIIRVVKRVPPVRPLFDILDVK